MAGDSNAGCLCGHIRMEISGEPITVLQCHCLDCQKSAGGGAALIVLLPRTAVHLDQGEPTGFTVTGDSGEDVTRRFCPDCGAQLYSELGKYPDLLAVKVGVWDTDPGFAPAAAIWTESAPDWHFIPDDIPAFPKARP
ncbi:Glutathione-dependent formaldehyde-activating enzyme [Roseovarius litorisediminis]|uniref:Glutathione-dependent formaldehyde-activating enzyme n=1 Tax=Roseovarius litorisediminis TaxID=1312363 RepID=A0A1Y5RKT5_9RHOB|nr:GFA family protein [Roseovarius litorisediminis]SLN18699.1 Glutathione-dependent formaldehyde-activating enzyme [Roseovarius litorisediminis]